MKDIIVCYLDPKNITKITTPRLNLFVVTFRGEHSYYTIKVTTVASVHCTVLSGAGWLYSVGKGYVCM